jgi:hypothetical protein
MTGRAGAKKHFAFGKTPSAFYYILTNLFLKNFLQDYS